MIDPTSILAGVVIAFTGLIFMVVSFAYKELTKAPPQGGSSYTLKNGMEITHWQKEETDFLYEEIFGKENAYAKGGIAFVPGATVVDAGANIGMFSLFASQECKGEATIYSFEPIKSTYDVLAANAKAAAEGKFDSVFKPKVRARLNLVPLNVGLSDKPAEVVFEHHPHFSVWSTSDASFAEARLDRIEADLPRAAKTSDSAIVRSIPTFVIRWLAKQVLRNKLGKTERVPAKLVTLSSVIKERSIKIIDLLKIDVEGAELLVLKGMSDADWKLVQQVALEVENAETVRAITSILKERGFETYSFYSERERNPGVESEVSMLYGYRPAYQKDPIAARKKILGGQE